MLGWNSALLGACSIACFGSLVGGVKLMARAAPLGAVEESAEPVAIMISPTTVQGNEDLAVSSR